MGWVTSSGSLGWKNALEVLEGLDGDQSDDGFLMSDREVESLFDGLRWMTFGSPGWVLIDVFYEIPHSCLEYGTGVNDWREIWLIHSMVGWNVVVPSPVGSLHSLMRNSFPWFSCVNVLMYMWILMVDMFMVFLFLLCWLYVYFMTTYMNGSQHGFTCIWMDNVSMT